MSMIINARSYEDFENQMKPARVPDANEYKGPPQKYDTVNRPKHYNREGAMESIEEMEVVFGTEAVMNFCLCNVWKYRYRAADKNGEEDIRKSDWYMKKYLELKEKQKKSYGALVSSPNNLVIPC